MSTDSGQLSTSLETWEKGDDSPMDGILSALIQDLDGDGQEELNTLLAEMYADLQSETGLTFKRCADTDMVNGMIAHTLIWSGRDLFYNHGEDDSTYVAALDNQYRDDKNTIVPFDYTEIVRK